MNNIWSRKYMTFMKTRSKIENRNLATSIIISNSNGLSNPMKVRHCQTWLKKWSNPMLSIEATL